VARPAAGVHDALVQQARKDRPADSSVEQASADPK
jgi:hypothetical protein